MTPILCNHCQKEMKRIGHITPTVEYNLWTDVYVCFQVVCPAFALFQVGMTEIEKGD